MADSMPIAVDVDGTIFMHDYPNLGDPVPGALEWLRKFKENGARIILFTMRSGKEMVEASRAIEEAGIKLDGLNYNPGQEEWTLSPKVYAQIYDIC